MARIKQIALITDDVEKTVAFFTEFFGLKQVGEYKPAHKHEVYLTDGYINFAITEPKTVEATDEVEGGLTFSGLHHVGFEVDDVEETCQKLDQARVHRIPKDDPHHIKYHGPNKMIVEIKETGHWPEGGVPYSS